MRHNERIRFGQERSTIGNTVRILSTGPSVVNEWELEVVTTVVLRGVTITGGTGNSFGVIVGIFLLGMLKYGMDLVTLSERVVSIVESYRTSQWAHKWIADFRCR